MPDRDPRIAVVGSGITGLSCAWLLSKTHRVTLFEKDDRFGGHSNTVEVSEGSRRIPVDTGFIVFNPDSYPNLVALFEHLDVAVKPTEMSFSVSMNRGELEYAGTDLAGLFAQRGNLLRPRFWGMLLDVLRFYRRAGAHARDLDEATTLGELLRREGYGDAFRDLHLLPMSAAIWSTPARQMLDYPALTFLRFCENHGLLQVFDRPQWMTVEGGSRAYVERLVQLIGPSARVNRGVRSIRRLPGKVELTDWQGDVHRFDEVVLACHADQALRLLADADEGERDVLGAFRFERNRAVLHTDAGLMPQRRAAWSSWNYLGRRNANGDLALSVSYWMNRLQGLVSEQPLIVTLNPVEEPAVGSIKASFLYDHPAFDAGALAAQRALWDLQGRRGTWFCGAWCGYGFHEDGLQAGLAVAEALGGVERPWRVAPRGNRLPVQPGWRPRADARAA